MIDKKWPLENRFTNVQETKEEWQVKLEDQDEGDICNSFSDQPLIDLYKSVVT